MIEIGVGFNTPGVVYWPMEQIVYNYKKSHLVCVNLHYPKRPQEIEERSLMFQSRAMTFVTTLWKEMGFDINKAAKE